MQSFTEIKEVLFFSGKESKETQGCLFVESRDTSGLNDFYANMIEKAKDEKETFDTVCQYFLNNKHRGYVFHFKYHLKDEDEAKNFNEVLKIKAKEPHHFVPVIVKSKIDSQAHLGFNRQITIKDGGPVCLEQVLLNTYSNAVLFIETSYKTGETAHQGKYVSLNRIVNENGQWLFEGIYLYPEKPDVQAKIKMYEKTFENMLNHIGKIDITHNGDKKSYCSNP